MNPNENHTPRLEGLIDDLIERGQPSGIPAADALASTIPQANPTFQQQLEDRLTAHLQIVSAGEKQLIAQTAPAPNVVRAPRTYVPFTLAAAMLLVILVGGLLLSFNGKTPTANQVLIAEETSTPVQMVNVLVAKQNLPRGFHFPDTLPELTAYIEYVPWPVASIPLHSLLEEQNGIDQLAGKILRTDVYREQPIMSNFLADDLTEIANTGSDTAITIPNDQLALALPLNLLTGMTDKIQDGSQIDISALVRFVGDKNADEHAYLQKIVQDATVVRLGDFSTPDPIATAIPDLMVISASREEIERVAMLIDAEIPLQIELSGTLSPEPITGQPIPEWSDPRPLITVPINQLIAVVGRGFQQGDHVSITAAFRFTTLRGDNLFQTVPSPMSVTPPHENPANAVQSPNDPNSAQTVAQVAVSDAEVVSVNSSDNTITLKVASQEEAAVLNWLLDAKIPLALGEVQATELPSAGVVAPLVPTPMPSSFQPGLIPKGTWAAVIDRKLIANDISDFKAEDTVDIAVSFLSTYTDPSIAGDPAITNTTQPADSYVATKILFTDVQLVVMGGLGSNENDPLVTFALSPEDGSLLSWILSAHRPIAITVMHSDMPSLEVKHLADGRISVEVPVSSVQGETASANANTVNVMTQINFSGVDPTDPTLSVPSQQVSQIIIRDAEMISGLDAATGSVTQARLIISPDALPALEWAIHAHMPLMLQWATEP